MRTRRPNNAAVETKRWLSFVLGGALNTAATYGIYLALNTVLPYQLSYFIAYASGVVGAYCINSLFVFRVPLSTKRFAIYPAVYVIQYVMSAVLLAIAVEFVKLPEKLAPLLVTALMVPVSYGLNKFVLREVA